MKFIKKVSISILVMLVINFLLPVMVAKSVQATDTMGVGNDLENVESYGSNTDGFHKIMGVGTLTEYQMINNLLNRNPNLSNSYVKEFISYVTYEAKIEGVNHDILYGLMMHETSFLNFGGDVKPVQNNFGGLAATGNGAPGNSFATVQLGIRAVTQHLKAYASTEPLKQENVPGNRNDALNGKRGFIEYVEYLGIQENPEHNGWAGAVNYGTNILNLISNTRKYPAVGATIKSFEVSGDGLVGSRVNISAQGLQDADTLYKIWVCDRSTEKWTILSDWSSIKTTKFKPSKAGQYTFVLHVKRKTKAGNVEDDYRAIDKNITALKSQAKSFQVTGNEFVGSKLSITADATPDTLYRIWVCDRSTEKWTILSDWSSTKTAKFTPSKAGQYTFVLHVKHKTKAGDVEDDYRVIDKNITALKSQARSFQVTGNEFVGSKLSITADATPDADTLYRIWVCDRSTEKWTILSDWSSTKTAEFIPSKAGQYTFVLHVKHKTKSGNAEDDYRAIDKNITALKSQVKSFEVIGGNLPGSKQTIKAEATPDADTLYRIWVCDRSTEKWTILSDWSKTKTAEFTPSKGGQYTFVLHVKHKTKSGDVEDDYRSIDKNIEKIESKLSSLTITGESKINSTLTIRAEATPADKTLYKIWVCNRNDEKWIVLSDYSKNNSVQYTPTVQGLYRFVVYVKHISVSGDVEDDYLSQDKLIGGNKLIVIDPGHGGTDPGAIGSAYKEKDLNLDLAYELKEALINKGYVVLMTRTNDASVGLSSRPAFANSYGADLLISVHHNSFNNTTSGVEVLYTGGTSNAATSSKIATTMSANISSSIGLYNRGGKDKNLCVCREANMPAVLVEAGFISNPTEEAYVAQNSTQQKIAKSIADTVYQYIY